MTVHYCPTYPCPMCQPGVRYIMPDDFWIDTMRDKMTGKLDKCEHGRYGYEACEECATATAAAEIERLRDLVARREDLCGQITAENVRLRAALTQFVAACDTAPPTSFMVEIGMACTAARAALQ